MVKQYKNFDQFRREKELFSPLVSTLNEYTLKLDHCLRKLFIYSEILTNRVANRLQTLESIDFSPRERRSPCHQNMRLPSSIAFLHAQKTDQVRKENFDLCNGPFSIFSVDFHCWDSIFLKFSIKIVVNTSFPPKMRRFPLTFQLFFVNIRWLGHYIDSTVSWFRIILLS